MILAVWISAFIPKDVPDYTKVVNASGRFSGIHSKKTAVPLPKSARLNPLNLIKNIDAGYLTDQRGFSDTLPAGLMPSVRMRSLAELSFGPTQLVNSLTKQVHESTGTTEVDMDIGTQLGFKLADMSRCSWSMAEDGSSIKLLVKGQAADPLVSVAADIDYEGTFTVTQDNPTPGNVTVEFDGKIDQFPAFECYAQMNGVTKTIFTAPPPAGNTVMSLPGPANIAITGKVTFP
jgi:hypothetical protein